MDVTPERPQVILLTDTDRTASTTEPALIAPDGDRVALPPKVYAALALVHETLLQGYAVRITALPTELSIDRAAAAVELDPAELRHFVGKGELQGRDDQQVARVSLAEVLAVKAALGSRRVELLNLLAEEPWDEDEPTNPRP